MSTLRLRQEKDYGGFREFEEEEFNKMMTELRQIHSMAINVINQEESTDHNKDLYDITDQYSKLETALSRAKLIIGSHQKVVDGIRY